MKDFDPAIINSVLGLLILINTLIIILAISAISFMLVNIGNKLSAMSDVRQSLVELTKVIEQNTRLLEYIGKNR